MDDAEAQLDRDATRMTKALEFIINDEREWKQIPEPEPDSEPEPELEIPRMDEDAL